MIPNSCGLRPRLETGPCSPQNLEDSGGRQVWQHLVNTPTARRASAQGLRPNNNKKRKKKQEQLEEARRTVERGGAADQHLALMILLVAFFLID